LNTIEIAKKASPVVNAVQICLGGLGLSPDLVILFKKN